MALTKIEFERRKWQLRFEKGILQNKKEESSLEEIPEDSLELKVSNHINNIIVLAQQKGEAQKEEVRSLRSARLTPTSQAQKLKTTGLGKGAESDGAQRPRSRLESET